MKKNLAGLVGCALAVFLTTNIHAAPLTPGDLVVYQVGDGSYVLSNAAAVVYLDEYTTSGTLVQQIPMPTWAKCLRPYKTNTHICHFERHSRRCRKTKQ